jgi:hypothetical protein
VKALSTGEVSGNDLRLKNRNYKLKQMKNILKHPAGLVLLLTCALAYASCQKEISASAPGKQQVKIFLTDGPVNFDAVNVDIQRVEVWTLSDSCGSRLNGDDDHDDDDNPSCGKWDTLAIRPGVYNLLNLSNGTDTLLASGLTTSGSIKKIRITLGTNNSVVADSVKYPLELHDHQNQVVIKVKGDDDVDQINASNLQLWMDFDAGRSIVKIDNNHFVLKPHINLFTPRYTAGIEGRVLPSNANSIVSAIANGDTLVAFPRQDGYFKIRGIRSATADVFINATANNYRDTTLKAVQLRAGKETNVGTIQLHQ